MTTPWHKIGIKFWQKIISNLTAQSEREPYQQSLRCWSSPGWRCWRWRRCLQRGRDILISHSVCPCSSSVSGGLFLWLFLAKREAGHSGDSDLSPFLLSRHRGVTPAWVFKLQVDQFEPHSVCTSCWWSLTSPAAQFGFSLAFTSAEFPMSEDRFVHAVH